jgi:hypothetical protein
VKVTYFLAANSVDTLLWPMVRQKMKLLGEYGPRPVASALLFVTLSTSISR